MMTLPSAPVIAKTLAALVDVLIPGDEVFPSASAAGAHGLVAGRIRERLGNDALANLVRDLNRTCDFATASGPEQTVIVEQFSHEQPDRFVVLRFATYYSYYEMPAVIAAMQNAGHDYNDAPQPLGYTLPPFDSAVNLPAIPRGSYKATGDISRIDLSGLADLELPVKGG